MNTRPNTSVVICTYNRAHLLGRVISSLAKQTLSPEQYEVIIVDNGSTDGTDEVCATLHAELSNLRYVSTGVNSGLSHARNVGIEEALGNFILFIDDDCIPAIDWIERLRDVLNHEPIAAGAVATDTSNYWKLCHNIAEFHAFMPGRKRGPSEFIAGANMGFRRSVLEELNGFKEGKKPAEDMEMILRARSRGYRVLFAPEAVVVHDPERTSMMDIFKYSMKHAAHSILLRHQYKELLRTPFILRSPALVFAASPVIALKVSVDIYLRNRSIARVFWTWPVVFVLKLAWCWGAMFSLLRARTKR